MSTDTTQTPAEQVVYSNMLFYGCWGSLGLMAVTYLLYISGLVTPHVPLDTVTQLWSQPVKVYLEKGNVPTGWGWLKLIGQGDFLNFTGVVLLSGMTILCYLPLIGAYMKKKEPIFATIAVLEILVLAFAASGIVGGGGH
ncbi:DUF1634 domain-containing protein [Desulfovibrio aerotolerans]|uniref:DUF1634 domain-containing protein n=1 Tax=Solidesulfovibrio aerotolerans TaxID=295255 RepID=A0A7C9MP93_9BACT|nr:DUF1634 domain-containing protein [Solidesulfovibrio aerotolerans]MYL83492.1 DUF1634 domain-containing protein [Solidesulfovibrio aerotolerans]